MPYLINYIPTIPELINGFFELAPMHSNDVVYDLGCGDGRLLFAAIEHGAGKAIGIDLDSKLIVTAQAEAKRRGLENRVAFINGDIMNVNLSPATVILCYLLTGTLWDLIPKFESELKPNTKIVTETFSILRWKPTQTYVARFGSEYRDFNLYVMPHETEVGY
jgi:ribosomal protein L11 methylase PrmA